MRDSIIVMLLLVSIQSYSQDSLFYFWGCSDISTFNNTPHYKYLGNENVISTNHLSLLRYSDVLIYQGGKDENMEEYKIPYDIKSNTGFIYHYSDTIIDRSGLDSILQSRPRQDLMKDGKWLWYSRDTASTFYLKQQKNILQGCLSKSYKQWFPNGRVHFMAIYESGYNIDSTVIFNEKGIITSKYYYSNSLNNYNSIIESISYYDNGNIFYFTNYKAKIGVKFYENGRVWFSTKYKTRNSFIESEFDKNGNIIGIKNYVNGVLIPPHK